MFCFNDELAVGALRALYDLGRRVPADVSVVGFDDIEGSKFTTPPLTSMRADKDAIADVALKMLVERIHGAEFGPRNVRVGHQLITRESTNWR